MSSSETGSESEIRSILNEPLETIREKISSLNEGGNLNIAILSLPYGGKSKLAEDAVAIFSDSQRITYDSVASKESDLHLPNSSEQIVVFDNCHYLYQRRVGGFELLRKFLDYIISSSNICITTWNIHSWNYLNQVMDISSYFSYQIIIPALEYEEITDFLLSEYSENEITFFDDMEKEERKTISFNKKTVLLKLVNKKINLYKVDFDFEALKDFILRRNNEESPRDKIMKKITRLSFGNPGIATKIWDKCLNENTKVIRTSDTHEPVRNIELDKYSDFILHLIVTMGHIKAEELEKILINDPYAVKDLINKSLFEMKEKGLVVDKDGVYSIRPEKLYAVIRHLENIRLVW